MKPSALMPAGRLERFFAYLIDTLILLAIKLLLMRALGEGGLFVITAFTLEAAYFTYFLSSTWNATPGQRLLSIATVRSNGRGLNLREALERFFAYILPLLPLYTSVLSPQLAAALATGLIIFWFAPILFTDARAGLHDQLCDTRVVQRTSRPGT